MTARPFHAGGALARDRLLAALARLPDTLLGLVVAPAGWGKTTLLSQFARSSPHVTVWHRADAGSASVGSFLDGLRDAAGAALGDAVAGDTWSTASAAADTLAAANPAGVVVVDDAHLLIGTGAERCLAELLDHLHDGWAVLVGSRRAPSFNVSRLRVAGQVVDLGPEDLRFRTWEVESLYRDVYGEALPPEELAELARRTQGWPAALQLFRLAITGGTAQWRRTVLRNLGRQPRLAGRYLTDNVLAELPADLEHFLIVRSE